MSEIESIIISIVDIIATAFLHTVFIWVEYKLLTPKKPGRFFRLSTVIAVIITDLLYQLLFILDGYDIQTFINHILGFLTCFIYALLVLKGSVIKKILVSIVTILIYYTFSNAFVVFWSLLGYSMDKMHEEFWLFFGTIIVIHLLSWVVYILFVKAYEKINVKLKDHETFQITIIYILTFIFFLVTIHTASIINDARISIFLSTATIFLFVINIITYLMIAKISKNHHIEQENTLLKMEKEYQKTKYEDTIRQSEQIKKLRHDYKNNLLVIRSLAEDKNTEEVIDFVSQGIERINATKMHVETNNEIVNAIVSTKMSEAAQQGIKVNFISISDFDGIDDFDLCNLISNLFDNAITAVANCETKIIELKITKNDDLYTIKMSNTISESVIEANPELVTTKEDNIYHGYGTKIIKDIADKYNGELDYYEEDGMFNFLVHLTSNSLITSAVPV